MAFLAAIGAKLATYFLEKIGVWALKYFKFRGVINKKKKAVGVEVEVVERIVAEMKANRKAGLPPNPKKEQELKDALRRLNSGTYTV